MQAPKNFLDTQVNLYPEVKYSTFIKDKVQVVEEPYQKKKQQESDYDRQLPLYLNEEQKLKVEVGNKESKDNINPFQFGINTTPFQHSQMATVTKKTPLTSRQDTYDVYNSSNHHYPGYVYSQIESNKEANLRNMKGTYDCVSQKNVKQHPEDLTESCKSTHA